MKKLFDNLLLVIALFFSFSLAASPSRGLYYSPQTNGHGFDLRVSGDNYILVFYTYNQDNQPTWYLSVATENEGVISGNFSFFNYDATQNPPQQVVNEPGSFTLDFNNIGADTDCENSAAENKAVFDWAIDAEQGSWCVQLLLQADQYDQHNYGGLWYGGLQDTGWGLSLDFSGEAAVQTEVAVLFYYDQSGFPRWGLGSSNTGGGVSELALTNFQGYCRTCPMVDLKAFSAGTINHNIEVIDGSIEGQVDLNVVYGMEPGGSWQRDGSPLVALSNAEPGLIPMPDQIMADKTILIKDTNLVPMTEDMGVIKNQSVLIENGIIKAIDVVGHIDVPVNTVIIDGRLLYLAPGMTEMHMHITRGNNEAMEQAGLLLIANGITSALNMGSSFESNVPGLSEGFESGEIIGPSLYTGQVAFGFNDRQDSSLTVLNAPHASQYAQRLSAEGYDFIKLYWQLSPNIIRRFETEGERLGLPLIGHIPLTQPMSTTLSGGQKMAAHIQEPFYTHMQSIRDEGLFAGAADVFLENGTYLTPTLAVFESYILIAGNNIQNYNELVQREGQQYVHQTIKSEWLNYFSSPGIQNSDQADLLELLAFYKKMTKFFFDAGVPLLSGTDAPGFPGVMSGFGVHEELRLLEETGIPPADVFAITTKNAGKFIEETLAPEVSFGTIEIGNRADLILLTDNPLEAIEHLKRPLAVISRGHFWSQSYLQSQLDSLSLSQKHGDEKSAVHLCKH